MRLIAPGERPRSPQRFFDNKRTNLHLDTYNGRQYNSLYGEIWMVSMREVLDITKALADGNRLRVLTALAGGELCVCQIVELLELAPSTVSKHMAILRQARLVEDRKDGRWVYYRLPGRDAPQAVRDAVAWVRRYLAAAPQIVRDGKKLQEILRMDPEKLCKGQCKS
jgi:ArsR family transcriptional regulator